MDIGQGARRSENGILEKRKIPKMANGVETHVSCFVFRVSLFKRVIVIAGLDRSMRKKDIWNCAYRFRIRRRFYAFGHLGCQPARSIVAIGNLWRSFT